MDQSRNKQDSGRKAKDAYFSVYTFAVIFTLFGIGSSSYNALFTASLSTLEKRYRFSSSLGGYTMITDNIATVMTSLFIGHYGKTAHKPRWMAAACLISGFSIALTALPYFFFGPQTTDDMILIKNMTAKAIESKEKLHHYQMCQSEPSNEHHCDSQSVSAESFVTIVALSCFAASNFLRGLGTSIFFTYGYPYLDDNAKKSQMPIIFAFIFASRLFGSPLGLLMSSFSLRYYENPLAPPSDLIQSDPTWIGAWWLGFVVFGFVLVLLAIPLSRFPAEFKKKTRKSTTISSKDNDIEASTESKENDDKTKELLTDGSDSPTTKETSISDLPKELFELIKNPLLVCQLLGNMFRGLGLLGFFVFQTKYIENQFSQPASRASFITGTTGFPAKIAGVLFGGMLIGCFKPGPRVLTSYQFIIEISSVMVLIYASTFAGPQLNYPSATIDHATGQMNLISDCNRDCYCEGVRYQPVCDVSGETSLAFFSACHAGCRKSLTEADNPTDSHFSDCSCGRELLLRKCQPENNQVSKYAWTIATGGMISGSGRTGNTITLLRSIRPDQKALAVALSSFWHSLVVSIPYPIVYGKIFDWSCMYWQSDCNKKGNCWLYDLRKLKINYHTVTIACVAIGSMFDLIMIFLSPRLGQLYDDDDKKSVFAKHIWPHLRGCCNLLGLCKKNKDRRTITSASDQNNNNGLNKMTKVLYQKPQETDLDDPQVTIKKASQ